MKTCTKCGEEKPLDAFGKHAAGLNGKRSVCKPCNSASQKAYREANGEWAKASTKAWRERWRREAIRALGAECVECGWSDVRALQIDHVHGDGAAERRKPGGEGSFYRKVVREADAGRYQLLCANHNWIKRVENGENGRG